MNLLAELAAEKEAGRPRYAWIITADLTLYGATRSEEEGASGPVGADPDLLSELRAGRGRRFTLDDADDHPVMEGRYLGPASAAELLAAPLYDIGVGYGCTYIRYPAGRTRIPVQPV